MTIIQAIFLGIVQGLTEFIPVSSSGHLVLAEKLFGINGSSLAFDVALHGGTLLALFIYFWNDIVVLAKAFFVQSPQTKLARLIGLATIPAVIAGVLLEGYAEDTFRSVILVSFNLMAVAIVMLIAEAFIEKRESRTKLEKTSTKQALIMGGAQALAIIPGVSRSGSTITAGLFAGMDRLAATRFSFLLGIPIISGAFLKTVIAGDGMAQVNAEPEIFVVGIVTSLIFGLIAINFMLKYLANHTLRIFAYYRLAVGVFVILMALLG